MQNVYLSLAHQADEGAWGWRGGAPEADKPRRRRASFSPRSGTQNAG
jgi:hypothetical protein